MQQHLALVPPPVINIPDILAQVGNGATTTPTTTQATTIGSRGALPEFIAQHRLIIPGFNDRASEISSALEKTAIDPEKEAELEKAAKELTRIDRERAAGQATTNPIYYITCFYRNQCRITGF